MNSSLAAKGTSGSIPWDEWRAWETVESSVDSYCSRRKDYFQLRHRWPNRKTWKKRRITVWDCLYQKRQDCERSQQKCRHFWPEEQHGSPVGLWIVRWTWYLEGSLFQWGEDETSSGTHWYWWNHLSTRRAILNPCLVGNKGHFPSTFQHPAEHSRAQKKAGGSHGNSPTMTVKCPSTPLGQ